MSESFPSQHRDIALRKKTLRKEYLGMLNAIPAQTRGAADELIRRRVADMPLFQQAERLFIFVGAGWEVDTWPLIEEALAAGKQVAVPRCLPPKAERAGDISQTGKAGQLAQSQTGTSPGVMEACIIQNRHDLRQVPPLGLWEPAAGAPVLFPARIDFALIPCVACDKAGRRLGRGGGYYDLFLAGSGFPKAALCRQALLQDELPFEAHDEKVDYIITETGLYYCG